MISFKYLDGYQCKSNLDTEIGFRTTVDDSYKSNNTDYRNDFHYNKCHNRNYNEKETNNGFFIKPHIKISKLNPNIIEDVTITSLGDEPETFDIIVWSIPIYNKDYKIGKKSFSKDVPNCYVGINVIEGQSTIFDQEMRLWWLGRNNTLPKKCNTAMSLVGDRDRRDEYMNKLPFSYIGAIFNDRSKHIPLLKDGKNEAVFLFTFPECDSLYVIPTLAITEQDMIIF